MGKLRVVQYINQFFAQVGGEDKADYPMEYHEGPMGPGLAFQQAFGDQAEIIGTIVCGDSYFGENTDKVKPEILKNSLQVLHLTPAVTDLPAQLSLLPYRMNCISRL